MKLEQQVTSLEISKKLKELDVKQESLFWWVYVNNGDYWELDAGTNDYHHFPLNNGTDFSAFTVAELGEMLPLHAKSIKGKLTYGVEWNHESFVEPMFISADTEADARGKMLIYLLENKLLTP